VNALFNLGRALQDVGRLGEGLASYDRALEMRPDWPEALNNRGNVLEKLGRFEDALASYDRALQQRATYATALNNRGAVLRHLKRPGEAAQAYSRLLAVAPDTPYALGWLLHTRLMECDWTDHEELVAKILNDVEVGKLSSEPWPLLACTGSPELQRSCALSHTADQCRTASGAAWAGPRYSHDRIRVAWLSDGFRNSVEAQTMVELMELQDRSRFETFGVSLSVDDGSPIRSRMIAAFEHFVDVRTKPDRDVIRWMREHEIDIVVAVAAYMGNWRPGILAGRSAPLQVNFGYPGTMGATFIDYLIADPYSAPAGCDDFYVEKVARLDTPFMGYYAPPEIVGDTPSRASLGLPEKGFVFCAFNASYKIQPAVFDVWMRLLHDIDGSVLWLRADHVRAEANLKREAERRGVSAARLIFAEALPFNDHLARYRAADLFIDAFPYGAQTTACEALWAGLPVVTLVGQTMLSRIVGGLLAATGLQELTTDSAEQYHALVHRLATTPALLVDLRAKLAHGLRTGGPFSPQRFCRQIETAFGVMYDRQRLGRSPESFTVPKVP
jgi:protein O-GlcNAc transferase